MSREELYYHGADEQEVKDTCDALCIDLTGRNLDAAEGDHSGTYFDRDHWVSAHGIAQALISAYVQGRDDA